MPQIYFVDVTNRDGVQTSRIKLAKLQKTMLNLYLAELGIHQSEFTFPNLRHEQNYIKGNLKLGEKGALGSLILEGWVRGVVGDVKASLPSGVRHLNISCSTSEQMITHKYGGRRGWTNVVDEMVECVICAREGGMISVGVNAEDASRTEMKNLIEFYKAAKEAGADRLRYCDTLGYDSPSAIYDRIRTVVEALGLPMELHCHNDLGMAVANSIAGAQGALDAGVDAYINATVNGIGERAGQADLVSSILAAKFAHGMEKYSVGDPINLKVAYKLAKYVSYAFGLPIPVNQPGVGANAFAHESGIHANGVLKDRHNYELYDYELLGRGEEEKMDTGRVITTGEYGGLAGLKYVYGRMGVAFPNDEAAQRALELVQYANAHTQLPLTDDELRFLAKHPEEASIILTAMP